jgi:cytochrome c551/c552
MKTTLPGLGLLLVLSACGGSGSSSSNAAATQASAAQSDYDAKKGAGKFTEFPVPAALDPSMAEAGQKAYDLKCSACHKLTDERLVGPGWSGVTQRHQPVWIMNFLTNVSEMIDKDPALQAQLEICLVRMPNQNVSDDEARQLLEFMRKNDGVK